MIADFLASPAGIAVKLALLAAFVDFATGTWRAWQDGVFALDQLAAFIRKHLGGRVLPLTVLALAGYASGDVAINTAAAAALTAYGAETLGSVYAALRVPGSSRIPID